jgi:hypothetical protein
VFVPQLKAVGPKRGVLREGPIYRVGIDTRHIPAGVLEELRQYGGD